ncbi:MAG: hypothetical protein RIS54_1162 [Verrucomicrobiota bacterium]|jgi:uncharacterized protein YqjF (DUF2071 family)
MLSVVIAGSSTIGPKDVNHGDSSVRPVGYQRWNHLLFLHWPVPPALVQATLPRGLQVDTFGGDAYVGIVPFAMERVRPARLPAVPWLSWFLELNVRTYVRDELGRTGVWFYSLDCNRALAVWLARTFFHLPYFRACISADVQGLQVRMTCQRRHQPAPPQQFAWSAAGEPAAAAPGSLEFFLVERYRLYAADAAGRLWSGEVRHAPYQFGPARLTEFSAEPARLAGFHLEGHPVSALSARPVEVAIFPLLAMGASR